MQMQFYVKKKTLICGFKLKFKLNLSRNVKNVVYLLLAPSPSIEKSLTIFNSQLFVTTQNYNFLRINYK